MKTSKSILSLSSKPSSRSSRSVSTKPSAKNIHNLREKTLSKLYPKGFIYKPKVSEKFLENWLDFPTEHGSVLLNIIWLPAVWLLKTNNAMAGLDPTSSSIRERLSNQCAILGTAAGLFLVIAVAGYLSPPKAHHPQDQLLIDVYGVLMFTATVVFTMYIGLSLTNLYPLVQSLRDDIAFDAFEVYMNRWGGYELFFFNIGFFFVIIALLLLSRVLYSDFVQYVVIALFVAFFSVVMFLAKEMFLSFDPITSMHLGLSSDPNDIYRAEMMSHYILNKIPNTILTRPDDEAAPIKSNSVVFTEFPHTADELQAQQPHETGSGIVTALIKKSDKAAQALKHSNKSAQEGKDRSLSSGAVMPFDSDGDAFTDLENQPAFAPSARAVLPPARLVVASQRGSRFTSYSAPVLSAPSSANNSFDGTNASPMVAAMKIAAKGVCKAAHDEAEQAVLGKLPSLESIFKGVSGEGSHLLRDHQLTYADSLAALEKLTQAGCESSEEIVSLLNETKGVSRCTCSSAPHSDRCSSRRTNLWMHTLIGLDIPSFHALKIVNFFKRFLK